MTRVDNTKPIWKVTGRIKYEQLYAEFVNATDALSAKSCSDSFMLIVRLTICSDVTT